MTLVERRIIRKLAGAYPSIPIEVDDTNDPPEIYGESYHWENKSGDRIMYPSAYKKAWGKPIYCPSTYRVIVGKHYLKKLFRTRS